MVKRRRAVLPALNMKELLSFFSKVRPTGNSADSCWEWTGYRDKDGYGSFNLRRSARAAHFVAWTIENGQVPDGLEIDHLCRNRACVRPSHMELVTHRENVMRGDTLPARMAAQTHCQRGHEFTPENTSLWADGARRCRTCRKERRRV